MFQENKSSILLEKKALSSNRNTHINIQYLFITDRFTQVHVSLVGCPTRDMIGEFMTNPLQGALFRKFRDQIMGEIPAQDPGSGKSQPEKSQTGKSQPRNGKPKKGKEYFFSLVLLVGQHHRSLSGEVKNGQNGQTHAHVI